MRRYKAGDRVRIVGGMFTKKQAGSFLGYAGEKSARVKIDRDNKDERTIRLKSIELIEERQTQTDPTPSTIEIDRATYDEMVQLIQNLKLQATALEEKLNGLIE